MRRRSELTSLRVEDIEWLADEGATILLRKSKTDQYGSGKWIHVSAETTNALHQWLSTTKINKGLIFRGIRSIKQSPRAYVKVASPEFTRHWRGKLD
jgi:integrase